MKALIVNPQIAQEVGPGPAVVHAVLLYHDDGQGAVMTLDDVGVRSGVSAKTAQRMIAKLRELGWVKPQAVIEYQVGQQANRYQLPTRWMPDPPGQFDLAYVGQADRDSKEKNKVGSNSPSTSSLDPSIPTNQAGNPPAADADDILDDKASSVPPLIHWIPMGSPMPMLAKPKVGKKGPFKAYIEAKWLVSHVEAYVLVRSNAERLAKGWKVQDSIPEKRKISWLKHAEILLADHDVAEVRQITDWVFNECNGLLPFDVIDIYRLRRKDGERKVTSVRKLLENYDELWGAWSLGKTTHTREVDYGKPLNDALEANVSALVATFEDFWTTCVSWGNQPVHTSTRREWTEQLRRLLDEHHLDVDELTDVIGGLKKYRSGMEFRRYTDPWILHRDALEWRLVRARLQVCREDEEERRRQHAPKPELGFCTSLEDFGEWRLGRAEAHELEETPVPKTHHPDRWCPEPWSVRRERIVSNQVQDAVRASTPGSAPPFAEQIRAALKASRTRIAQDADS